MSRTLDTLWPIEPHTQAKHKILRRYLGAWFPILGKYTPKILYLDGFCGPGRYTGGEPGSPIIAIETALNYQTLFRNTKFLFFFVDNDKDRIAHLQSEIARLQLPSNFEVYIQQGNFQVVISPLLDEIEIGGKVIFPTFAFIDPFGFGGIPFRLVRRLLKIPKAEVLINVMIRDANRFLNHPDEQTRQHILELFGTEKVLGIIDGTDNRITTLRRLYLSQLQKHARFVRYFEMHDRRDQIIYYLFFASNHPLGHEKMKEAFWKIDASSGYKFSDATNPNQMVLFELDPSGILSSEIQYQFCDQSVYSENVLEFVVDNTAYIRKHARMALILLENKSQIVVEPLKKDGNKRRKNSFPSGTLIHFSE